MRNPFIIFWTVMIFGSIFWYCFLVFHVGFKAGREILIMLKALGEAQAKARPRE